MDSRNDDREEGLWEWDDLLIREDDFLLGYNLFPNAKSLENFLKIFSAAGSTRGGKASTVGGVVDARTTWVIGDTVGAKEIFLLDSGNKLLYGGDTGDENDVDPDLKEDDDKDFLSLASPSS